MKLEKITQQIIHVSFEEQEELTKTFLRFQEHYESPRFAGKVFSLEEFKEWYRRENEAFTYYTDWAGFNIPDWVLSLFRRGDFDPLSIKEKEFLKGMKQFESPFYIIGTFGDNDALKHEIGHGLFYTVPEYREAALEVIEGLSSDAYQAIYEFLLEDYHERTTVDEVHAYLLDGPEYLSTWGIDCPSIAVASKQMNGLFEKYFGVVKC